MRAICGRAPIFGAFLFAAALAWGQERSAVSIYRAGENLYERGDLAGALAAFERAYALDPRSHRGDRVGMHFEDYDPAFQLGRIHARLGECEPALRYFAECAASGYTKRSENAEEYARWKGIAERASALARSRVAPPSVATAIGPPSTTPAASAQSGISKESRPPPTAPFASTQLPEHLMRSPHASGVQSPVTPASTPPPTAFAESRAPVGDAPLVAERRPTVPAVAAPATGPRSLFPLTVLGILGAGAAYAIWRSRRAALGSESPVVLGRYSISGLLGAGAASFVYAARDRKTGDAVALRVRHPNAAAPLAERFRREAAALERLRGRAGEPLAPLLFEVGTRTVAGRPVDYIALERLSGRTVLDLSRNARRPPDPPVLLEILDAVARALADAKEVGLHHPELSAADVYLVDPVPLTAGSPVRLRILGLLAGEEGDESAVRGLASIARELFPDEGSSPDAKYGPIRHDGAPEPLRQILRRIEEGPLPTLAEFCAALERCRVGPATVARS